MDRTVVDERENEWLIQLGDFNDTLKLPEPLQELDSYNNQKTIQSILFCVL